MTEAGGCHCGAVRYEVEGTPQHVALCHCKDCRKSAGAPMVAWAAFSETEPPKKFGSDPDGVHASGTKGSAGAATTSNC